MENREVVDEVTFDWLARKQESGVADRIPGPDPQFMSHHKEVDEIVKSRRVRQDR
jgi:hypothetical protein